MNIESTKQDIIRIIKKELCNVIYVIMDACKRKDKPTSRQFLHATYDLCEELISEKYPEIKIPSWFSAFSENHVSINLNTSIGKLGVLIKVEEINSGN